MEDGTFSFTKKGTGDDIQYSLDNGGTWVSLASGATTPTITAGNQIIWKSTITPNSSKIKGIGTFSSTGNFDAQGNIMSLLYGNSFNGNTDLNGKDYAFYGLFGRCTKLINTNELILPATTLANNCYFEMFSGCTSLTTAPELPATTLVRSCYYGMFRDCTSLSTAPELPATTLDNNCYDGMFYGCTSLTTAPELPATTLANYCYYKMFNGCENLSEITMLATNISASYCLINWVSGVSSTGTFVKHPDMTTLPSGISGIPEGWTVVDYQG